MKKHFGLLHSEDSMSNDVDRFICTITANTMQEAKEMAKDYLGNIYPFYPLKAYLVEWLGTVDDNIASAPSASVSNKTLNMVSIIADRLVLLEDRVTKLESKNKKLNTKKRKN